jgi:hypothetical protein
MTLVRDASSDYVWRRHSGRVAQRESTPFTREGSQVQSLSRPPEKSRDFNAVYVVPRNPQSYMIPERDANTHHGFGRNLGDVCPACSGLGFVSHDDRDLPPEFSVRAEAGRAPDRAAKAKPAESSGRNGSASALSPISPSRASRVRPATTGRGFHDSPPEAPHDADQTAPTHARASFPACSISATVRMFSRPASPFFSRNIMTIRTTAFRTFAIFFP